MGKKDIRVLRAEHERLTRLVDDFDERLSSLGKKLKKEQLTAKTLLAIEKDIIAAKKKAKALLDNGFDVE